jgi:hypothetical protein
MKLRGSSYMPKYEYMVYHIQEMLTQIIGITVFVDFIDPLEF